MEVDISAVIRSWRLQESEGSNMGQCAAHCPESGRLGGQDRHRCTLAHLHVPSWV